MLGYFWSLSVEEQFYLLWPSTFVVLGWRRSAWVAVGVVALSPLARIFARLFLAGTAYADMEMFPMVADGLACGCLLALGRDWLEGQSWYTELFRPVYSIIMIASILS